MRTVPRRVQLTLTVLALLSLAAILAAVLIHRTSSLTPATQVRTVPPFSAVDLAGANNVVVRVGGTRSVAVHADENLLRRVTTHVRSGTLVIDTTPGDLAAKRPMYVAVTVPALDGISLEGTGNMMVSGLRSRRLTVALPGSGVIHATGSAARLDVRISGYGTAQLGRLTAHDVNAAVSGDGSITLTATHSLDAAVSGSGTIVYGGNPAHVTTSVTGQGTIAPV